MAEPVSEKLHAHPLKFFEAYQLKPREQQQRVLDELFANWDKYSYFALSLPTGVGKTYIATALADVLDRVYILTSTLQLQSQYESSWDRLVNLKGRGNYACNINKNFTVDAAPCSVNDKLFRHCRANKVCAYYNQKDAALASRAMITNPVYMLYSSHCGFAKGDLDTEGEWIQRSALIIDEAHNLENHLISFAESEINPEELEKSFGLKLAVQFDDDVASNYTRIEEIYEELLIKAEELSEQLTREFPKTLEFEEHPVKWARGFSDKAGERAKKLNTKIYALDKAIQPLKIFFNTHGSPEELQRRWLIERVEGKNALKLSPLYGDFLFDEYLSGLGYKFVFLSATLGSKETFCRELGIDDGDCLFIETDSPFDPQLSPIIVDPVIKLSKEVYGENVKKLGPLVDHILDLHEGQRGIIHCVTYDLQKHVYNGVSARNKKRLLCRDMDQLSGKSTHERFPKRYKNEELLALHSSKDHHASSVLLSPSMMEGVDLKDDLSDFQVIIKLPWSNLGDPRVKVKSKLDGEWYTNKMWLSVLQACGRSTRHETDSSVTYILDSNFKYFYGQRDEKLPEWFKHRLVFK